MTVQNVVFLALIAALALAGIFHLNFILTHSAIVLGGCAVAAGALFFATSQGMIDWDEWIPRGRD